MTESIKPPLFDDTELQEFQSLPPLNVPQSNLMDIGNRLYMIKKIRDKAAKISDMQETAREYYATKIEACQKAEDFLGGQILAYLEHHGLPAIQTHLGTARIRESKQVLIGDEAVLAQWAKDAGLQDMLITEERVSKMKLRHYIEEHPEVQAPGVTCYTAKKVSFTLPRDTHG